MRHFTIVILLTLVLTGVLHAQETADPQGAADGKYPKITTLVDEFGALKDCDLSARIDNLFITLNHNPEATGYIITYNAVDALPSDRDKNPMAERIRRAMAFRKYDMSRLVFINGGFRPSFETQFYLVPQYAIPPEPSDTVAAPEKPKGTYLWTKDWLETEENGEYMATFILPEMQERMDREQLQSELESEVERAIAETGRPRSDEMSELTAGDGLSDEPEEETLSPAEIEAMRYGWINEKFGGEVARVKGSHGVIVFYADDEYYDIQQLMKYVEQGRDRIAKAGKVSPSQIKVVYGGYGGYPGCGDAELEYHIVSKGSKDPKPAPRERSDDN